MKRIEIYINDNKTAAPEGSSVASILVSYDPDSLRRSVSGQARYPLCGMGTCFECRVEIDGIQHQRSCQILVRQGMKIRTDEAN